MVLSRIPQRLHDSPQLRFIAAGAVAAGVNWLVRFPIELVMPFTPALLVATAIGMVCGFWLYRAWVFPGSDRSLLRQVRDFVLVNIAGQTTMFAVAVLAHSALLAAGTGALVSGGAAHMLGIAVGAVTNYFGHRHVTFASPPDPRERAP